MGPTASCSRLQSGTLLLKPSPSHSSSPPPSPSPYLQNIQFQKDHEPHEIHLPFLHQTPKKNPWTFPVIFCPRNSHPPMPCVEIFERTATPLLLIPAAAIMVVPPALAVGRGENQELATAPSNGSDTRGAYGTEMANFDTNMVIILAALLCALIFALGLNSIIRCALRCGRHVAFEASDRAAGDRLASAGLKKRALHQLPITVYGSGSDSIRPSGSTDCPICLGEFADGEKIRVLPSCNHWFHVKCIDRWLVAHSSCPTCRHSLLDRTAAEAPDAEAGRSGGSDVIIELPAG